MVLPKLIVDLTNDNKEKRCSVCGSILIHPETSVEDYLACSNADCENWGGGTDVIRKSTENI